VAFTLRGASPGRVAYKRALKQKKQRMNRERERKYPGQVWETIMLSLLSIALFAATIALPGLITIVVSNAVSAR
jgi:hypothetical protein